MCYFHMNSTAVLNKKLCQIKTQKCEDVKNNTLFLCVQFAHTVCENTINFLYLEGSNIYLHGVHYEPNVGAYKQL